MTTVFSLVEGPFVRIGTFNVTDAFVLPEDIGDSYVFERDVQGWGIRINDQREMLDVYTTREAAESRIANLRAQVANQDA